MIYGNFYNKLKSLKTPAHFRFLVRAESLAGIKSDIAF